MKVRSTRERAPGRSPAQRTPPVRADPQADRVLALQRTIGNRATTRMLARDDYGAERGDSTLPDAPFELYFDGRWLRIDSGGWTRAWKAVSGSPVFVGGDVGGGAGAGSKDPGKFDYSPQRQRVRGAGPIPEGKYWIDPRQLVDLIDRPVRYLLSYVRGFGTHRITIHPFTTTETFGRGGFFIHGGATPGSAGCIDLWTHMASFARELRSRTPEGHKVKLTVEYDQKRPPESWD